MDGWLFGRMAGCICRWMEECLCGSMYRWMDEWMDLMDGPIDR
jgi:hypothetical protein